MYCTTDAATAKEMSMPPEMSTTTRPTAKITFTELVFSRLKKFAKVKNCGAANVRPTEIAISSTTSHDSVGCE